MTIRFGLFLFKKCLVTAEFTAFVVKHPEYSFYLGLSMVLFLDLCMGGKIPNMWVHPQEIAVKWQICLHQRRKIPMFWDWTTKACAVGILI